MRAPEIIRQATAMGTAAEAACFRRNIGVQITCSDARALQQPAADAAAVDIAARYI